MELNREQIIKALDWLDSLIGNSNDSDIAMFTYQLLGILYDTCEELTEENERLMREKTALECVVSTARNQARADTVREIFSKIERLLDKHIAKANYTDGTFTLVFKRTLEVDIAELKKKYTEEGK